MSQEIVSALYKLDVKNDAHWTADGLPRLDTVKMFAANPSLTRELVEVAAPGFNRSAYAAHLEAAVKAPQEPAQALSAPPAVQTPSAQLTPAVASAARVAAPETGGGSNAQEAQPPEVGGGQPNREDEIAALEKEVEATQAEVARLRGIGAEVERSIKAAQDHEAALIRQIGVLKPADGNPQAIRAYLDSVHARNMERANRRVQLNQLLDQTGLNPKMLSVKSPLDASLANRRRQ